MIHKIFFTMLALHYGCLAMQIGTNRRLTAAVDPLTRVAMTSENTLRQPSTSSGDFQRDLLYPMNELELQADRRHDDDDDYHGFFPNEKDIKVSQMLQKIYHFEINNGDKILKAMPFVKFGFVGLVWAGIGLAVAGTLLGVAAVAGRRSGLSETQMDEMSQLAYRILSMIEKMATEYADKESPVSRSTDDLQTSASQ